MKLSLFWIALALTIFSSLAPASPTEALRSLPLQDAGRIKPFDTFARESLELVYGKTSYEGKPAYEIVMTWLLQPQAWQDKPLFEIKHHLLKRALNLNPETKYVSPEALMKNERLAMVIQELQSKREAKEKLDPYGQAMQRLENQLVVFREIAAGRMIRLVPSADEDGWLSLPDLNSEQQEAFIKVTKNFAAALDPAAGDEAKENLRTAVRDFMSLAERAAPSKYASLAKIEAEVHYNSFHPFKWAWISYLLALIFLVLVWVLNRPALMKAGWLFTLLGFAFHFYGFALRVYLTGRPPVSNMYETVLWVSFGTVLFSMIIEAIYRWRVILLAGSAVGAFCLVLTDLAPAVLDPSLQPLEPVLRSNFWLTIHVLTITISYAAFFLAFALGDLGLFFYLKDEKKYEERIRATVMALYRAMQIGVAFLAPGIILGGVWADYSWGRFWGWDPKETWALIALLGYIAVLHARLAGLIKNFGMVCTAVITFSLVIMAWYGVNFVLGAGLHSYGFGAGGVEYVSAFVALHILFVIFVAMVRRGRLQAAQNPA
jgi:cytochrome c-type biogenesis protein CcsB